MLTRKVLHPHETLSFLLLIQRETLADDIVFHLNHNKKSESSSASNSLITINYSNNFVSIN